MSYTDGKIESSEQRMGKRIIVRNLLLEILLTLVGGGREDELDIRLVLKTLKCHERLWEFNIFVIFGFSRK